MCFVFNKDNTVCIFPNKDFTRSLKSSEFLISIHFCFLFKLRTKNLSAYYDNWPVHLMVIKMYPHQLCANLLFQITRDDFSVNEPKILAAPEPSPVSSSSWG